MMLVDYQGVPRAAQAIRFIPSMLEYQWTDALGRTYRGSALWFDRRLPDQATIWSVHMLLEETVDEWWIPAQ